MTDHPDLPMRAVPSGRFARAQHMGGLATGLVGGIAFSGAAALLKGQRPRLQDLVMTPANIARLTARLSEMRGAAMKLGQLLSMETGGLLSPELEAILARLRAGAHVMPPAQLKQVLTDSYGPDFRTLFSQLRHKAAGRRLDRAGTSCAGPRWAGLGGEVTISRCARRHR